jgi:hypothetical protein
MLAGLYTVQGRVFHGNLDCFLPLRKRGFVWDEASLRQSKRTPCPKCWNPDYGYRPSRLPEQWEEGA